MDTVGGSKRNMDPSDGDKRQRRRGARDVPGGEASYASPVTSLFQRVAKEVDDYNERRERIIKASRDLTYKSKKIIYALQRVAEVDPSSVDFQGVKNDLADARNLMASRIASEVPPEEYWRFQPNFSPGMQEYVEAAAFYHYVATGALVTQAELQNEIHQTIQPEHCAFFLCLPDYLLGLCDTTGELMRVALNSAARSSTTSVPFRVCNFLQDLHGAMASVQAQVQGPLRGEVDRKMDVMAASVQKVETVCYSLRVRAMEFQAMGLTPSEVRPVAGADLNIDAYD